MADDPYFASRYTPDPARDRVWGAICRYLQRFVPEDGTVLDLGAGYCSFVNHIRAATRHALDASPELPRHAADRVKTHVGRCEDLSAFETGSLDAVFASNLLEHLEWPSIERTVDEVRRALKPQGRLVLLQPNFRYCSREYFDYADHTIALTHLAVEEHLYAAGFAIDRVVPRYLPYTFRGRLPTSPALVRAYLRFPLAWKILGKQYFVLATNEDQA